MDAKSLTDLILTNFKKLPEDIIAYVCKEILEFYNKNIKI